MSNQSNLLILLGKRIRHLRKERKLTILSLATSCSTSEKHLGQVERGKSNITLELLEEIAKTLKVNPCDLLTTDHTGDDKSDKNNENIVELHAVRRNKNELQNKIWNIIENADTKLLQRIYRVIIACQD